MLPSLVSPTRRNGVTTYFRRYLNTVSDWQTYSDVGDVDEFNQKFRDVTTTFFSSRKLKGMSFLLAAHLLQQTTASIASLVVRTAIRGSILDTYRGITIRKAVLPTLSPAIHSRIPALLTRQPQRLADWLEPRCKLVDSYLFMESGRTWHCWTINANFGPDMKRNLTVLSLVGFPNRMYLFDRPVSYAQSVDITLSLVDPDSIPGYLGGTNELDSFIPAIMLVKLGVYALGWLLMDNTERDQPGPDVNGYDRWTPPPPPPVSPQNPAAGQPPSPAQSGGWYNLPLPFPTAYGNPYPAAQPQSPYSAAQPQPYPAAQPQPNPYVSQGAAAAQPPQAYAPARPAGTPVSLVAAPVKLRLTTQRPDGSTDDTWYTVNRDSFVVVRGDGHQTGLAVSLKLGVDATGEARSVPGQWTVIHTQSGLLLSPPRRCPPCRLPSSLPRCCPISTGLPKWGLSPPTTWNKQGGSSPALSRVPPTTTVTGMEVFNERSTASRPYGLATFYHRRI